MLVCERCRIGRNREESPWMQVLGVVESIERRDNGERGHDCAGCC